MARIALLFGSFRGGGVGRARLRIAGELPNRGPRVDLIVGRAAGDLLPEVPDGADVIELRRSSAWWTLAEILAVDPAAAWILFAMRLKGARPSGKLRLLPDLVATVRWTQRQQAGEAQARRDTPEQHRAQHDPTVDAARR